MNFDKISPTPEPERNLRSTGMPSAVAAPYGVKTPAGSKADLGKPRMDLLDPSAMEQLASVLTFGAEKKYAAHNWRLGIQHSRLIAAALRHIFAFNRGEDLDPESGLPHIAHAMCCCMFILGSEGGVLDDRYLSQSGDQNGN